MKEILIANLAKITKASHESRATSHGVIVTSHCFTGVSTDSRSTQPGDCFFAIAGPNFDGHKFLADAFAKGASCAVVSKDASISNQQSAISNKVILKVPDTVQALGELAAWYRKDCNFKVVAITGSVGKTTTRQIIHHVLSRRFKTHQSLKNFNNFIGLPLSILAASPDDQILILELATNHPGEIEYLAKIAAPDVALVTNVHPAHLAGFGTIEKIAEEKLAIAKGLLVRRSAPVLHSASDEGSEVGSSKGVLIINADSQPLLDAARRLKLTFRKFSCFDDDADYHTDNLIVGPLASTFTIDKVIVEIPLPGRGNVENALASWSVCSTLGVSARDFADAVKTISPVSMRTELLQIGSLTVINDCYNANPASMKNALDILTNLARSPASGRSPRGSFCAGDEALVEGEVPPCGVQRSPILWGGNKQNGGGRRRVFICGDMAELGDDAQALHRQLGEQIAGAGIRLLITLGTLAALAADAAQNAAPNLQTRRFTDPAELCDNLHKLIKDSDIILVKGSRINKLELVVEKLKLFSDT